MDHRQWASCSDSELSRIDLAELSFNMAVGLPSAVSGSLAFCRERLDEWVWTSHRKTENSLRTERHRYPLDTDGRFRMLNLVSIVLRDLGVRYNQAIMEDPFDGRDSCELLLHGILFGRGGSCVTMPLLYAAIGRRLGYPLFLCYANEHVFLRWQDQQERFNVEGTSWGFSEKSDEDLLRSGPGLKWDDVNRGYLTNLTPRHEVACLLAQRGRCLLENLQIWDALTAFHTAHEMHPVFPPHRQLWGISVLLYEIFGEQIASHSDADPDAIDRESHKLTDKFGESIIRRAKEELTRIVTNWNTRPVFREPDLRVPGIEAAT